MEMIPGRYFISHSYADDDLVKRLSNLLPAHIDLYTFPPILVRPEELVSNELVTAIRECEGLIFIEGGNSDSSFWVAFEIDFALRLGKPVYSFADQALQIHEHRAQPLDLAVFASYHKEDKEAVRKICTFMKTERHFDLWFDADELEVGKDWASEISTSINARIERKGYVVVFWSEHAEASGWVSAELETALSGAEKPPERILFALLDRTPLPEFWNRFHEPGVQLFGDGLLSSMNRIDDLVVRLYWQIYRKTKNLDF